MKKTVGKRILSLLLCLLLALSTMGITAFAEEAPVSTEPPEKAPAEAAVLSGEEPSGLLGEQGHEEAGPLEDGTSGYTYIMKFQGFQYVGSDFFSMNVTLTDEAGQTIKSYQNIESEGDKWDVKVIEDTFSAKPASITVSSHYHLPQWVDSSGSDGYEEAIYTVPFQDIILNEYATDESVVYNPGEEFIFCKFSVELQGDGAPAAYVDAAGNTHIQENVRTFNGEFEAGEEWYAVRDSYEYANLTVNGNVNLILCDDMTLTANAGVELADGASLTIWGQTRGSGKLTAYGYESETYFGPGIYVPADASLTINGGTVEARGQVDCAGIGGGNDLTFYKPSCGTITINGGAVEAYGGVDGLGYGGGAGIGSGGLRKNGHWLEDESGQEISSITGPITINGGNVKAYGGALDQNGTLMNENWRGEGDTTGARRGGAGIGGGYGGTNGLITINGGTVEAVGGAGAAGIGAGDFSDGGPIVINGGDVTARADVTYRNRGGAAIGAGYGGDDLKGKNGPITITGGNVYAETANPPKYIPVGQSDYTWENHRNAAAAIGAGGNATQGGKITISGGEVVAISNGTGAGIGGARAGGEIEISGDDTLVFASSVSGAGIGNGGTFPGLNTELWPYGYAGGNITINGGNVIGVSSYGGAGIGTGVSGHDGTITINGGIVRGYGGGQKYSWFAETNKDGFPFGIEGGFGDGNLKNIYMRVLGAVPEDYFINWYVGRTYSGAGIGGGDGANGGTIRINGGVVAAMAGNNESGAIGNGKGNTDPIDLELYDNAKVTYGDYEDVWNNETLTSENKMVEKGVAFDDDRIPAATTHAGVEIVLAEYTVTFDSDGGTEVEPQTVTRTHTAVEPEQPVKEGNYTFGGWYLVNEDGTLAETPFDFNTPITENITLKVLWITPWMTLQAQINNAENGAVITLDEDVVAYPEDVVLVVPAGKNVTIDLGGHKLDRAREDFEDNGQVITVQGNLTVIDSVGGGTITGGKNKQTGGGVLVEGGRLTLTGGAITGNQAQAFGGGVAVAQDENYTGGTFTMTGGEISNNSAANGGGLYFDNYSQVTLTGGSITGNTAQVAGGVLCDGTGIKLSGAPVIEDNLDSNEKASNLYLQVTNKITISGTLTDAARIGVTMSVPGVFTKGLNGKGTAANFFSDNSAYTVKINEAGEAYLDESNGYYLIGPDWTVDAIDAAELFETNPDNANEYMLSTTLAEGDEIKVVHLTSGVIDAWYPDGIGTQYTVDAAHAGDVTVYFKTSYDNAWSEFGGYFWIEATPAPVRYFVGNTLSLSGDIGVNFFVDLHEVAKDNAKVVFTWGSGSYAKTEEVSLSSLTAAGNGYYKLTARVAAAQMTDLIHAELYDGDTLVEETDYSVAQYANYVLTGSDEVLLPLVGNDAAKLEKLRGMCKALLIYGAKAQKQFNYRTDDPADAGLTYTLEEAGALGTTTFPEGFEAACGIKYAGSSLILKTETTYRMYFTVTDQAKLDSLTVTLDGKTLSYVKNGSYVYYEIANIPAAKVVSDYTLTFGDLTVTANAGEYMSKALAGSSETLKETMTALYWYTKAAQTYFGVQ